jgi:hypothetical protein
MESEGSSSQMPAIRPFSDPGQSGSHLYEVFL